MSDEEYKPRKSPRAQRAYFATDLEGPIKPADNMRQRRNAQINASVDREWYHKLKVTAATHGISITQLLVDAVELWYKENKVK